MLSPPLPYLLKPDDLLFFLHIPKTAGTTLISLLDQHYVPEEICPEQLISRIHEITPEKLSSYRLFRGHLDYDLYKRLPRKPVYITMLRDPVRRVASLYDFWRRNSEEWVAGYDVYQNIFREAINSDLYDFVCSPDEKIRLEVENNQTRRIVSHTRDPLDGYTHEEILEIAKKRIADEFLFCGLVESFDESLQLLCYTLGWSPVESYEMKMVTPKKYKTDDIPVKARDAILERNQLDIALYAFARDLFNQRYQAMIDQLLKKNYVDHFTQRRPAQERLDIIKDYTFSGMWYPFETTPDGTSFRWMGPLKEAAADVRLTPDRDMTVTIEIINSIHPDVLNSFTFWINGNKVPLTQLSGDERQGMFQGTISRQMIAQNATFTRLTIRVNRTYSPHDLDPGNLDARQLSLAFRSIVIEPVKGNDQPKKMREARRFFKVLPSLISRKKDK